MYGCYYYWIFIFLFVMPAVVVVQEVLGLTATSVEDSSNRLVVYAAVVEAAVCLDCFLRKIDLAPT
jgi:hypothetical protein